MHLPDPTGSSAPTPRQGSGRLRVIELATETLRALEIPFSQFASVRAEGDQVVAIAGAPNSSCQRYRIDLNTGQYRTLKKATDILDRTEQRIAAYLTAVEVVEFSTTGGNTAFGLFYRPHNPDYAGPLRKSRHCSSGATVVRLRQRRARSA